MGFLVFGCFGLFFLNLNVLDLFCLLLFQVDLQFWVFWF